uniref:SNF-related serine/threonine-protein kinase n=1 Tax=Pithovirus LCPAC001 TaxID=2506585 RepID=A0A481Z1F3_9VIRU|nr:MAG: SNF-related serine/threonine-protein kinase [Pithovirus LCPAC001]
MDIRKPKKLKNIGAYTSVTSPKNEKLSQYYQNLYKSKKILPIFQRLFNIQQEYIKKYMIKISINPLCQHIVHKRYDLDIDSLVYDSQKKFYVPEFLQALACYSSYSIFINSPYKKEIYKNIYAFWKKIRSVASGKQGTVYESTKLEQGDAFLIKVTSDEINSYDTYHEIFAGFVLNRYRTQIPNFMYTYGYIDVCGPLHGTNLSGVKTMCISGGKNIYSIVERINPGTTLKDFLNYGMVTEDFLKIYLQIILALHTARDIQYVHNDLHTSNVVMRNLSKMVLVPYKFRGKTIYIKTNKIPTIIDYGYSYFKLNGNTFGVYGVENSGVYWDRYHPIMDSFKILMFMIQGVGYISDPIQNLVKFFDKKADVDEYFGRFTDRYDEYYFDIPYSHKTVEYTHELLIDHILKHNKGLLTRPSEKYKILGCNKKGICEFDYKEYITKSGIFYNSFAFQDLMKDSSTDKFEVINKFSREVNYFFKNDLEEFNSTLNHVITLNKKIDLEKYKNLDLLRSYIKRTFSITGAINISDNKHKYENKIKKIIPNIISFANKVNMVYNLLQQGAIQYTAINTVLLKLKMEPSLFEKGKKLISNFSNEFKLQITLLKKMNLYLRENAILYTKGYNFFEHEIKSFFKFLLKFQIKISQYIGE